MQIFTTIFLVCLTLTVAGARSAGAGSPLSNDPSSLAVCQEIIRGSNLGLATDTRRAISSCVMRGIECLVNDPKNSKACCTRIAGKCDAAFDKIDTASRRFTNHITNRRCSTIPLAELVNGLGYAELGPLCRALDPAVEATDLAGLVECLRRLVIADTTCQIAILELPLSAEALACMSLEDEFVAATGADPSSCRELSGVGSPTPTVTATRTATPQPTVTTSAPAPTPTGTSTPVASSTATTTPIASATLTATPQPTATVTAVIVVPTVTSTPQPTLTPRTTATATRTATPVPTSTPGCGNNKVDPGETCDDGNTNDCDACPSDCRAAPTDCPTPAAQNRYAQQIRITGPTELGGVQVCLKYPAGTVGLPGTSTVGGRISGFAGSSNVVDFNNATQIAVTPVGSQTEFTLTLSLDRCVGAPVPAVADFQCVTKDASDTFGNALEPPTIVECTPTTTP